MVAGIQLKQTEPLAMGRSRLVFQHPHNDAWLVKVMRPEMIDRRFGSGTAWYKRRRRFGPYLSYVREIQEHIAGWASHRQSLPYFQKIIGLVETDFGLGLVIEAVRGRDGKLAKPLSHLLIDGEFDAAAIAALERFFDQLLDCDLIISDLNRGNLVYAFTPEAGDHFVMIDGIGGSTVWPVKSLSRRINRRSKAGRIRQLRAKIAIRLRKNQLGL